MPISENELMWTRTQPEEVEANAPEVLAGSAAGGTVDDGQEQPSGKEAEAEAAKPVVRVEETSRLEATLARLEMNSIEIKMHLDSLEQRISRMEPHLEERSRGGTERVPEAEPVRARTIEEEPVPAVAERTSAVDKPLIAEATAVSREAKEDRWSHLMGPDFEAGGAAARVPPVGVAARADNGTRPAADTAEIAPAMAGAPEATSAIGMEAGFGKQISPRFPVQTEAWEARPLKEVAELAAATRLAPQTGRWAKMPVAAEEKRPAAAHFEVREPVESFLGAEAARRSPVQRDFPVTITPREGEELGGQGLLPRRMFSVEQPRVEEERPSRGATGEPGMWRGYRVRRLVLAVALLVLAAIPLAIWWRLSIDARDADGGDAAPASRVEPGAVALPKGKPRTGGVASAGVPGGPERATGAGGTMHGNPSLVWGAGRAPAAGGVAEPVARRRPSVAVVASALPVVSVSGRTGGGRTSSGPAAVGGTEIGLAAGQPGGADEVPGTSGLRVRVPEGVMAGHLLPTGDVGELPRGSGQVVAAMFISNTGRVEDVEVISGNKGLRDAAARAMRTWRYEPYVQAGVRVPVVTTASIRFDGASGGVQ